MKEFDFSGNSGIIKTEEVEVTESKIVNGVDLVGKINYSASEFAHDVETAVHAQGFDGVPQVVEYEDFAEAMKKSNFYAERTYSAPTKQTLQDWQEQLYSGEWYIDCSTGGAQYGQGMYCAACYDLKDAKSLDGIGQEMLHYQALGLQRGNKHSVTEAITLRPDAKILELPKGAKAEEYITDQYKNHCLRTHCAADKKEAVEAYIGACEKIEKAFANKENYDVINALYDEREVAASSIGDELKEATENTLYLPKGGKYSKPKNPGTLAVEMGYDAINAVGHGQSGSYTVILNRTKVLFCKGGLFMAIKFERDKQGNVFAVDENGKSIGYISTMGDFVEKEAPTKEQLEIEQRKAEFEKQRKARLNV